MSFGPDLAKERKAAGWTQDQAAAKFGAHSVSISNWETGRNHPVHEKHKRRIVKAFPSLAKYFPEIEAEAEAEKPAEKEKPARIQRKKEEKRAAKEARRPEVPQARGSLVELAAKLTKAVASSEAAEKKVAEAHAALEVAEDAAAKATAEVMAITSAIGKIAEAGK